MMSVNIDMEPEFFTGDTIAFNYTIDSDSGQTISYMESVDCPNAPHAMLDPKSALVNLVLKVHGKYNYLKVTDNILSQNCTAYVIILEPVKKTFSKPFAIITALPFEFNILLDKKIFVKGENINIDYKSEVKNPSIEASLIYPDKSIGKINLPYSFKANQIGTYELSVTASKEGYKKVSLNEQFGVIKENANVKDATFNGGFAVQGNSNSLNKPGENPVDKIIRIVIYVLIGFVLLVVINEIIKKVKHRE